MQRKIIRGQWLLSGLLVMMLASACVQPTGDQLQPTGFVSIATFTLPPTTAPQEVFVTSVVIISATPDFSAAAQDVPDNTGGSVDNPIDNGISQLPTDQPVLSDDQILATAIILGATQTVDAMTAIAQPNLPIATNTPEFNQFLPTSTPAPLQPGADCIDEVRAGDNLFRISQRYGLTVADIASRNGITNVDLIFPGQMLSIPGCGTTGYIPLPTSTPTFAPTPFGGGTTGGTTDTTGGGIFITFTPSAGGGVVTTGGQCGTHTIAEGESLFQIAIANGTTVAALSAANGIVNVDEIDMGDTLIIPC